MARREADPEALRGRTIGITADRRWDHQADFFRARGATIVHAPTMRTLVPAENEPLRLATGALLASPPTHLAATTGIGINTWLDAAEAWGSREALLQMLGRTTAYARGAKAASAMKRSGLRPAWQGEQERMRELVDALRANEDLTEARVALPLDGTALDDVHDELVAAGADVVRVPLYRWTFPDGEDRATVESLIDGVVDGTIDACTFTSAPAARNLMAIADEYGRGDALRGAALACHMVCVGPVCAEAAREIGLDPAPFSPEGRLLPMLHLAADLLSGGR